MNKRDDVPADVRAVCESRLVKGSGGELWVARFAEQCVIADRAARPAIAADKLAEALRVAKRSILEDTTGAVACTIWVPNDVSPCETLVDHIDAALAVYEQGR